MQFVGWAGVGLMIGVVFQRVGVVLVAGFVMSAACNVRRCSCFLVLGFSA